MSSLLRLRHLMGRSNSNRSSSSGMSHRSSRSESIPEQLGDDRFHDDSGLSGMDLVPVTYNVQIPSLSCRRKRTFYVHDKNRKINIRVKRPENASPGEVIQVTAHLPATTTSNPGGGSDGSSYSASLTATSVSSIGEEGEGEEEQTDYVSNNEHEILDGRSSRRERNSIIVLYADPLVCKLDGESSMRAINGPAPNFERERQLLIQSISESRRDIELSFDVATTCRFQKAISRRYGCLHFSGHGKKGYLFYEDGKGGAHVLRPDQVQVLFNELPFKLVFVSACHSEQIGQAFLDAGIPHIICCDHEAELQDEAAVSFTNIFYHALALGHTVDYSFRKGKEEVSRHFSVQEAEKFLLLPENGDHDEQIFDAEELPEKEMGVHSSRNQFIPELSEHFLGRRRDAYELLQKILDKRIVKLVGRANGVGCSSLAKFVCRYIKDRKTIFLDIQSIYYLRKGYVVDTCIRQLHEQLAAEGKVEEVSVGDETSQDILLNNTLNALCEAKALIVFDDVSDENLIEFLTQRTSTVKILQVTTSLMEVSHHSVGPLDFESSVQLFGKECQHARNFEALYEKLNRDSTYFTTNIRWRISQTLEHGIPSQIIRDARGISQEDYQSLFFDP